MTESHFSRHELFILRNHIPVDILIKDGLKVSSRIMEGYFRFCCPVCREFNTGVNLRTNLARCFRCEKNYNTIDLVMLVRRSNFIHSIKFLKKFHDRLAYDHKYTPQANLDIPVNTENNIQIKSASSEKTTDTSLVFIGRILKTMKVAGKDLTGSGQKVPKCNADQSDHPFYKRILQLKQKVEYLIRKIETMKNWKCGCYGSATRSTVAG